MLDSKYFSEKVDDLAEGLKKRNFDLSVVDKIVTAAKNRKANIQEVEKLKAEKNAIAKSIGAEMPKVKSGDEAAKKKVDELKATSASMSATIETKEAALKHAEEEFKSYSTTLPNIPHASVPAGKSAEENKEIKKWGDVKKFSFQPKDHADLGEGLGILDFEAAVKITGARFSMLKGAGARLERALMNFMLDIHTKEHGYEEVWVPYMVNRKTLFGTGQLPKFEQDLFKLVNPENNPDTDFYLIPTAEVPVTNIYRDSVLDEKNLPISFTAYTPCFRSEAGSHGRDTKGLIRQHQFDKVEIVKFSHPEKSYEDHETLVRHAEVILERLELPYRRMLLCAGDMGFGAAKCYDLEVWLPGQGGYREISSCSNFEDFQARRANIKFKSGPNDKPRFVHTLNGSGLAIGRTWLAILENFQQEDGSVLIPKALQSYVGVEKIKKPE